MGLNIKQNDRFLTDAPMRHHRPGKGEPIDFRKRKIITVRWLFGSCFNRRLGIRSGRSPKTQQIVCDLGEIIWKLIFNKLPFHFRYPDAAWGSTMQMIWFDCLAAPLENVSSRKSRNSTNCLKLLVRGGEGGLRESKWICDVVAQAKDEEDSTYCNDSL